MINIRLNVLRLLDDDTITSIQCSCTRRSYSNGEESKLAHGKHRYDSIRSLSNTRLKATVRNCRFCTVSKRYPVKRGCHSMRWAEQTLGRQRVRNVKTIKMTTCENSCNAPSACKAEELARSRI